VRPGGPVTHGKSLDRDDPSLSGHRGGVLITVMRSRAGWRRGAGVPHLPWWATGRAAWVCARRRVRGPDRDDEALSRDLTLHLLADRLLALLAAQARPSCRRAGAVEPAARGMQVLRCWSCLQVRSGLGQHNYAVLACSEFRPARAAVAGNGLRHGFTLLRISAKHKPATSCPSPR